MSRCVRTHARTHKHKHRPQTHTQTHTQAHYHLGLSPVIIDSDLEEEVRINLQNKDEKQVRVKV